MGFFTSKEKGRIGETVDNIRKTMRKPYEDNEFTALLYTGKQAIEAAENGMIAALAPPVTASHAAGKGLPSSDRMNIDEPLKAKKRLADAYWQNGLAASLKEAKTMVEQFAATAAQAHKSQLNSGRGWW